MSSDDPSRPPGELDFVETTPAADVIGGRSPRPPVRWGMPPARLAALLVAVLLAGVALGYLAGRRGDHRAAPTPTPTPTATAGPGVMPTQNTCFGQLERPNRFMLGVEVANNGAAPVVLIDVRTVLPLGGLRMLATEVGRCDSNSTREVAGNQLRPGALVWVSATMEALSGCPAPDPVLFRLRYALGGAVETADVGGFADLSSVPLADCPAGR